MATYDQSASDRDNSTRAGGRASARTFSPFQALFLIRLNRLLNLRQEAVNRQSDDEWRLKLLSKSIYSTFCDCVELGVVEDARTLFERAKSRK